MNKSISRQRPNIVLMVADDHGREALGCYGNPVLRTPHLDALADGGVRFDNAFCTTPSCAASRSVILTGMHNHTNGTYGHTHAKHHFSCFDDVVTLPALLNAAGYRTGCIGKKHFAPESIYPFAQDLGDACGRDDVRMAGDCENFIGGEDPFFLYWCSFNPHRAKTLESHPLRPDDFGNPSGNFPGDREQPYSESEVVVPPWLPDTPEVRAELAQYYQSISRLDRGVGRLMELLKKQGKFENTLIIYLSDNGAAFPASKTTFYDPGVRLPCLVRAPGGSSRKVSPEFVAWYDWVPTILDYAGVAEVPKDCVGSSLRPLLEEGGPEWTREEIYISHSFHGLTNYYPMRAVCRGRYKFIWNLAHPLTFSTASDLWNSASWRVVRREEPETFGCRKIRNYLHRPRFELYDLESDPNELSNLAEDPEQAERVADFCEKLKSFQTATRDPWVTKWEYE